MPCHAKTPKQSGIRVEKNLFSHALAVHYYHGEMCRAAEPLCDQVNEEAYGHETGLLVDKQLRCTTHLDITYVRAHSKPYLRRDRPRITL